MIYVADMVPFSEIKTLQKYDQFIGWNWSVRRNIFMPSPVSSTKSLQQIYMHDEWCHANYVVNAIGLGAVWGFDFNTARINGQRPGVLCTRQVIHSQGTECFQYIYNLLSLIACSCRIRVLGELYKAIFWPSLRLHQRPTEDSTKEGYWRTGKKVIDISHSSRAPFCLQK